MTEAQRTEALAKREQAPAKAPEQGRETRQTGLSGLMGGGGFGGGASRGLPGTPPGGGPGRGSGPGNVPAG